jgi:hypothetical protein
MKMNLHQYYYHSHIPSLPLSLLRGGRRGGCLLSSNLEAASVAGVSILRYSTPLLLYYAPLFPSRPCARPYINPARDVALSSQESQSLRVSSERTSGALGRPGSSLPTSRETQRAKNGLRRRNCGPRENFFMGMGMAWEWGGG